jgi:hypothetical protein
MAREAWPKKEVVDASRDAICLAVYRWKKQGSSEAEDSEWAKRLDVKGYPQIRILDGWGRPLPASGAHEMDRTAQQVAAAIEASKSDGGRVKRPDPPAIPEKLLARLAAKDHEAALDPIGSVRCRVWLAAMEKGPWPAADLVALLRADDDPVLRVALIERLGDAKLDEPAADALADALVESVGGNNDYVRGAAMKLLGTTGGPRAVKALADTIGKALDGGGFKNTNNVLCEAVDATIATPDKQLVDVLGRVLATQQANNQATLLATRSLVGIGRKFGADLVKAHLERARKMEGPLAGQIRKEVESLLGK